MGSSPARPADEHDIVVGIDGRDESYEALEWAVQQARLTGARVRAVCAWHYVPEPTAYLTSPPVMTPAVVAHAARRLALDAAAAYAGSDVTVIAQAAQGTAWRVLVDAAENADLLVLGSRHRPLAAGAMLGSVTLRCMAHAPCPVVVVPSRARLEHAADEREHEPARRAGTPAQRPMVADRRKSRVTT